MGQTSSSCPCCPCLSSEYTQIKDDESTHPAPLGGGSATKKDSNGSLQMVNGGSFQHQQGNGSSTTAGSSSSGATSNGSGASSSSSSGPGGVPSIDFDFNSSVFKGSVVQQKFFNKSSYEAKFAWINLKSRSLCLSEHMTKERRHKEASIGDVTGVICGPPEKYKATIGTNGEPLPLDANLCLSVKFIRGGGIDLKFTTMKERDDWADVILRLINSMKRNNQNELNDPASSRLQ